MDACASSAHCSRDIIQACHASLTSVYMTGPTQNNAPLAATDILLAVTSYHRAAGALPQAEYLWLSVSILVCSIIWC